MTNAREARTRGDPIAHGRDRFALPDGLLYLDGHSLKALSKAVAQHLTTVARIIGFRRGTSGTGSTSGVNYLQAMLDMRLFPEMWDLRTQI